MINEVHIDDELNIYFTKIAENKEEKAICRGNEDSW